MPELPNRFRLPNGEWHEINYSVSLSRGDKVHWSDGRQFRVTEVWFTHPDASEDQGVAYHLEEA